MSGSTGASLAEAARRYREGDLEGAAACYRAEAATPADSPGRYAALLGLTRVWVELGRFEAAATACREAIACAPERPGPHGVLALALVSAGRLEEAATAAAAALERAPRDVLLLNLSASIALRRGHPGLAGAWSRAALARDPHDQRALADLAFASSASGGAEPLLDLERLLRVTRIATPDGFGSVDAFQRALTAAIVARVELKAPDADAPLVGGRRLPDLFALDPCWTQPLLAAFRSAVDGYIEGLAVDTAHPVRTGRPARLEFVGWVNVMADRDFERPHIHEGGWLSGVYYVETPPTSAAAKDPLGAEEPPGGALLLGGHHCEGPLRGALTKFVPCAGEIVLFPSYVCHRTVPFTGPGRRISIAFDVLRHPGARRVAGRPA
jgi:hypothetical protein